MGGQQGCQAWPRRDRLAACHPPAAPLQSLAVRPVAAPVQRQLLAGACYQEAPTAWAPCPAAALAVAAAAASVGVPCLVHQPALAWPPAQLLAAACQALPAAGARPWDAPLQGTLQALGITRERKQG